MSCPPLKIRAEKAVDVALDVLSAYLAAVPAHPSIGPRKNGGKSGARIPPLIDDLFEDARVGMLGDEAGSEQLDAFASDLFDDGWIVQEPPAPEGHQVIELSRIHAQLVLILAAQHADQEAVVRVTGTKVLQGTQVGLAGAIARQS